jgi:hypothetical protein
MGAIRTLLIRSRKEWDATNMQWHSLGLRFGAPVVILVLLWSGSAVSQTWQSLSLPGDVFTIEMPGAPKYKQMKLKSDGGTEFTLHQYVVDTANSSYVAEIATYPHDVDVSNPCNTLQGGLDNAAQVIEGGKWDSISWVQLQGLKAFDALGHRNGLEVRLYGIMNGSQNLVLGYAGPVDTSRSADVSRFIASLHVRN